VRFENGLPLALDPLAPALERAVGRDPERGFDRRTFLRLVGGGLAVLVTLGPDDLFAQGRRAYPEDLNAYLLVGADGRVTVFTGKIEMGQGVMTSQAQMVAEELGVELAAIDMVMGDTDRCPWDMGTFGSLTTRMFGPVLRAAAAEARLVLLGLAAKRLGAARDELRVEGGVVRVASDASRRVGYGELAEGRQIARLVGEKAVLRQVKAFREMGSSPLRLDGRDKVTGAAGYAADLRRPGMLWARVLRPPAHGVTMEEVDTSAAGKLPGVRVVREGDLVAVLHETPDGAAAALGAVRARWSAPAPGPGPDSIFEHLKSIPGEPQEVDRRGDPEGARSRAAKLVSGTFHKGYVAHAPIEPHAAVAELVDGKMTVWASTQTPFPTRESIASTLGFATERVRVVVPYVGGGFGGKSAHRQALEAARLAQASGRPVAVAWTREEEFFYDTYDPAAVVEIDAALDGAGKLALWSYDVHAAGARSAGFFYDVPHLSIRSFGGRMGRAEQRVGPQQHAFAVGPWRAPGANMNVFARESHVDVLAAAAGVDPLDFRLRNLSSNARMRRVLETAAEAFGWRPGNRPGAPSGRGQGVACGEDAGSYVALMAEVEVDRKSGRIRVVRVVCAQDMGIVVNPEGAKMQIEGCVTMGLGYTLAEELRFDGGRILDTNFDTYELPRFSWLPEIEAVLVPNDELDPQGGGEPAIVPMGAVVANAVFDATGARLRRLPMTPERVLAALRSASA